VTKLQYLLYISHLVGPEHSSPVALDRLTVQCFEVTGLRFSIFQYLCIPYSSICLLFLFVHATLSKNETYLGTFNAEIIDDSVTSDD